VEGRDDLRRICSISECYPQEVCTELTVSKVHPLDNTLVLERVLILD
jgi:5S rRNA maturation endonuclease (ribonuclease M5)